MFFHLIQELQRAIALEIPGTEAERSVTSSSSRRRMMTLPPSGFGLCTCHDAARWSQWRCCSAHFMGVAPLISWGFEWISWGVKWTWTGITIKVLTMAHMDTYGICKTSWHMDMLPPQFIIDWICCRFVIVRTPLHLAFLGYVHFRNGSYGIYIYISIYVFF